LPPGTTEQLLTLTNRRPAMKRSTPGFAYALISFHALFAAAFVLQLVSAAQVLG
jgi:hypothetical protein